jgi:hypothetical protein
VHLTSARLCLNCEEIHDAQACPACASENYAYLTRWVPAGKRHKPRRILTPTRAQGIFFGSAGLGALVFWLVRWSRRVRARIEDIATGDTGELR